MKKEYRIKKNSDIEAVLNNKKYAGSKYYIMYIKENHEANHFRVGFSVSKKIGNAVVRNHEKRRLRNAIYELRDGISNYDIFIIARKNCLDLETSDVTKEIKFLLKRSKIFK